MPGTRKSIGNHSLWTAALEGLELQKQRIEEQIQEVRLLLGQGSGRRGRPAGSGGTRSYSRLSPEARQRIAAAQKRRWAKYRKAASGKAK
jgi:hypothetical protein